MNDTYFQINDSKEYFQIRTSHLPKRKKNILIINDNLLGNKFTNRIENIVGHSHQGKSVFTNLSNNFRYYDFVAIMFIDDTPKLYK